MIQHPVVEDKFLQLVKIRIGEPLTAVQIDEQNVIFGSISGYVGHYHLEKKKTSYFEPICQELIQGIYSKDKKYYIAVGDKHVLIKNLEKSEDQKLSIVRDHINSICSHSIAMMHEMKQVIFCAFPTQKRDPASSQLQAQKNRLYEVAIDKVKVSIHHDFRMGQDSVPFDFDGQRLLWMQYQAQGQKQFKYYDLKSKQIIPVKKFDKTYHFLSFGKLIQNQCIFVQNNKNVKLYDMEKATTIDLYSHASSIVAFNISNRNKKNYSIISVDFYGYFVQYRNKSIVKNINLFNLEGIPEKVKQHKYLFDMGYPYFIKLYKNVLAVTTDLGLGIYKLG